MGVRRNPLIVKVLHHYEISAEYLGGPTHFADSGLSQLLNRHRGVSQSPSGQDDNGRPVTPFCVRSYRAAKTQCLFARMRHYHCYMHDKYSSCVSMDRVMNPVK